MLKIRIITERRYAVIFDDEHLDWLHGYLQNCFSDEESNEDYNHRFHIYTALSRLKQGESDA